jgi:hypothetical protein
MDKLGRILYFLLNLLLTTSVFFTASVSRADDVTQLGWPASLGEIYKKLDEKPKNYFILISRIPSIAVDFRTEEGMKNSINSFSFQKNFHPGHEIIGWKCNLGGTRYESVIGFSGESDDQHVRLLNDGWGLSALLATFKDGFVQTPQELENRFKYFNEENDKSIAAGGDKKINLMSTVIEITEDECSQVINEVYEYTEHPKNPTEKFSMILSPSEYEGAGCGSFALHFMERIDSLKATTPFFRRQFHLPNYLFGTGAYLPDDVEIPEKISRVALRKPVSKLKLISSSWTSTVSPNIEVEITDPELIVFWQKLFFQAYYSQNNMKAQAKSFNKQQARGIWERIEDQYNSGAASNHYVAIDKDYDTATGQLAAHSLQLLRGAELTYFTFSNFPGIILEKK